MRLNQAGTLQQGSNVRLMSTESYIQLHGIGRIASLQYLTAETTGYLAIENTHFLESCESIGIQHFRPFVTIVSGCIASRSI